MSIDSLFGSKSTGPTPTPTPTYAQPPGPVPAVVQHPGPVPGTNGAAFWSGLAEAEVSERGRYFPAGFVGEVRVANVITKRAQSGKDLLIVECEILSAASADVYPEFTPGTPKAVWIQNLSDQRIAFPAVLGFLLSAAGITASDPRAEEVKRQAPQIMAQAVDGHLLDGRVLRLETYEKTTQRGTPFTVHSWSPAPAQAAG